MSKRLIIIITSVSFILVVLLASLLYTQRDSSNDSAQVFDENRVPTRIVTDPSDINDASTERPPQEVLQAEQNYYRVNVPDVFVANLTPFENDFFSITTKLDTVNDEATFVFFVEPRIENTSEVQAQVENWLLSNGLTNDQISELEITFR